MKTHLFPLLVICSLVSIACGDIDDFEADEEESLLASAANFRQPSLKAVSGTALSIKRDLPAGHPKQFAYDYAPTLMQSDGKYKLWWCGTVGDGDNILYSETTNLDGRWSVPEVALKPAGGNETRFDAVHACDPDVIKSGGKYYMYYGGLATRDGNKSFTKIGIATSTDGRKWSRALNGHAIIGPKSEGNGVAYGAGQPSVVKAGYFYYMLYTTVWRNQKNAVPIGGEFAIRSKDPLFRNVEELQAKGWTKIGRTKSGILKVVRDRPLFKRDHVKNIVFLRNSGVFMVTGTGEKIEVGFYNKNFEKVAKPLDLDSPNFAEQRAVLRDERGQMRLSDAKTYNLRFMSAIWNGRGDKKSIFNYDVGRQSAQLRLP